MTGEETGPRGEPRELEAATREKTKRWSAKEVAWELLRVIGDQSHVSAVTATALQVQNTILAEIAGSLERLVEWAVGGHTPAQACAREGPRQEAQVTTVPEPSPAPAPPAPEPEGVPDVLSAESDGITIRDVTVLEYVPMEKANFSNGQSNTVTKARISVQGYETWIEAWGPSLLMRGEDFRPGAVVTLEGVRVKFAGYYKRYIVRWTSTARAVQQEA